MKGVHEIRYLVPKVRVLVSDEVQKVEADRQEPGAEEVSQRSEVRDGRVVGVDAHAPHPVHHYNAHVQQDDQLNTIRLAPLSRSRTAG